MPSTLTDLEAAWHTEARSKIRLTLLNKSRRSDRQWQDIVGNNPLRHLDVAIQSHLQDRRPHTATHLIERDQRAITDRFTALFDQLLKDQAHLR